jgi:hypothetical protein
MTLPEILLSIALGLPAPWYRPGHNPETVDEYRDRMEAISQAIAVEAEAAEGWRWDATSLAAATLVTWYAESRFALEVHNGSGLSQFGEDEGRARCFGQLHATGLVPKPEWQTLTGVDLEATRRCARATMRVLTSTANRCGMKETKPNSMWAVARMLAAYMSGKGCAPTKASTARARRWSKVMDQIKSAAASEPVASSGQQG